MTRFSAVWRRSVGFLSPLLEGRETRGIFSYRGLVTPFLPPLLLLIPCARSESLKFIAN